MLITALPAILSPASTNCQTFDYRHAKGKYALLQQKALPLIYSFHCQPSAEQGPKFIRRYHPIWSLPSVHICPDSTKTSAQLSITPDARCTFIQNSKAGSSVHMETPHTAGILSGPLTQTTDPLHCHSCINMFSQKSFYDRRWPYNVFFKIILLVFRFCQLPMHMNEVYHRPELIK